ncbi:MAG: ComEC/Rec2 family competence protein [Litoreibacter sp.]|uniref:ComEC/Rec2 family competence protein n=1 Tax=Litoreibacter sp. TaxID=1969459 RepID=UPI003296F723
MIETRAGDPDQLSGRKRVFQLISDDVGKQHRHLFTWSPVAFGIGVGLYFSLKGEPAWEALAGAAFMVAFMWAFVLVRGYARSRGLIVVVWGVSLVISGLCVASFHSHRLAAPVLSYRYYGPIEGRVVAIDTSASQKPRLTLDQVNLSRVPPKRTPKHVRVSLHGPTLPIPIGLGDYVMTTGHLGPPSGPVEPGGFDFQRHLWFQQIGALGYTRNPVLRSMDAKQSSWGLALHRVRRSLSQGIQDRMSATEGPFAAAIVTGDRSSLDQNLLETLRASNLAHLLAISGLHMGLLTGAVFFIVRLMLSTVPKAAVRLPVQKIAAISALIAAILYLGISGANVATQRAFIMVSVMLLAICVERPALSLRAVAIAGLIILVLAPQSLVGPGFQMSFAATTALVAVFGYLRDRGTMLGLPRWMRGFVALLLSSFIAGAATAPFGAAHFNQLAHYGLLANLLSVPVMGFVVMPGALIAAVLTPLGGEYAGLWVMEQGLSWILGVSQFVANLDGSTSAIIAPNPWVLPLISLGGLTLCIWQGVGRVVGLVPIALACVLWVKQERPIVLIAESGRLIGILKNGVRGLNKPKGDGFAARVWLENDGDKSDQAQAAARSGFEANLLEVNLSGQRFGFNAANPDKIDEIAYCAEFDLVILPRVETELPNGCEGWTALDFKTHGSVAIYLENSKLRHENSRSRQGDRLWVAK